MTTEDRSHLLGRIVRFVCTGDGEHGSKELANVGHFGEDPEQLEALVDEFGQDEGHRRYEYERIAYMESRPGKHKTVHQQAQVEFADVIDGQLVSIWLLRCPDLRCPYQMQINDDDMRQLVESLCHAGDAWYDISQRHAC